MRSPCRALCRPIAITPSPQKITAPKQGISQRRLRQRAVKDSLKRLSCGEFAGGRQNVTSATENVMPAFGQNKNAVCYLDNIFVYLRARANDAIERGRPQKHEPKPLT